MNRIALCVGFAAVALLGTAVARSAPAPKAAVDPKATVDPNFYAYDSAAPLRATETPVEPQDGAHVSKITFPSPVTTSYPANNRVTAFLFLPPKPGPHPAMVVLHEWNAGSPNAGFRLCGAIVRAGVAALLVEEPYSLDRRPPGVQTSDAQILSGDVPHMVANMRQAVIDARRGLDYLAQRPDVDANRLGVSGISLGGVLSGVVASVDPRVKVVLTLVGGADFARGFWNGLLTRKFRGDIQRRGYSFETFQQAVAPVEAANWARPFDPADALLMNGRDDVVIFPEQARALSCVLGGAPIVWANTGHYGLQFSQAQAGEVARRFLRARFFGENTPFRPPSSLSAKTIKLGVLLGGHEGASPLIAYTLLNLEPQGRLTLDGQLTLHGLSGALSARLGPFGSIGVEFPLLHGPAKLRPFVSVTLTL